MNMLDYQNRLNSLGNSLAEETVNTEPVIMIDNRAIELPITLINIVVAGDINSKKLTFQINRYFDGVDLSKKTLKVKYCNAAGLSGYNDIQNIQLDVTTFTFDWLMSGEISYSAGEVLIALEFTEQNTSNQITYEWQTKPTKFNVEQSFDVKNDAIAGDYSYQNLFLETHDNGTVYDEIHDSDAPVLIVGRQILMPILNDLVVSKDSLSQIVTFTINRYVDGVDLFSKMISIKFINAIGKGDRAHAVNIVALENTLSFGWLLDGNVTIQDGYVEFAFEFLGHNEKGEFYCWQTTPANIRVSKGLDVDSTMLPPSPSWIQEWELESAKVLHDAKIYYDLTKMESDKATLSEMNAKASELSAATDAARASQDATRASQDAIKATTWAEQAKTEADRAASEASSIHDVYEVDAKLETHTNSGIYGELGIHMLRYFNEKLQVFNDSGWIDIETGGGGGITPGDVSNIYVQAKNGQLNIKFADPDDDVWAGTKIVRKAGAYPENVKDGVVILDNKVKDNYATTPFVDSGLTNGTVYYYHFYPYSATGAVNSNIGNRGMGMPQFFKIMTVKIDLSNSNPATCCTYYDDAAAMEASSSAWDDFFGEKPCLLKDGINVGYLNPNDFTKFVDGSTADITSGDAGDVMIEFPRRGLTMDTVENILTIRMTDDPDDENFKYCAHQRDTIQKNNFYLGAYKGFDLSSKLRSLSGKTPTVAQTIGTFRTQAQANGVGYENSSFYQLMFRQCMYLLKYRSTNSQIALGMGYVNIVGSAIDTGSTNALGMDFGEKSGKLQIKLFGIEDFWGNLHEWVDGIITTSTRNILTATTGFNNEGIGYTDRGQVASANIYGYISKPQGTTEMGFLAKEFTGSATTYFCDYVYLYGNSVARYGSDWNDGLVAGVYALSLTDAASTRNNNMASRLMYLEP